MQRIFAGFGIGTIRLWETCCKEVVHSFPLKRFIVDNKNLHGIQSNYLTSFCKAVKNPDGGHRWSVFIFFNRQIEMPFFTTHSFIQNLLA